MGQFNSNRLVLMRHAKSDWDSGQTTDFLRPLASRGQTDARRMGAWLASAGYWPKSVLSSPATRTRETIALLGRGAQQPLEPGCNWMAMLYDSSLDTLCDALCAHDCESDVLVMGHNPGLEDLVDWLLPRDQRPDGFSKLFPTAAVYVLDCASPLTDLERKSATLVAHQRPKLLDRQAGV